VTHIQDGDEAYHDADGNHLRQAPDGVDADEWQSGRWRHGVAHVDAAVQSSRWAQWGPDCSE
jgi:hypothetical protein